MILQQHEGHEHQGTHSLVVDIERDPSILNLANKEELIGQYGGKGFGAITIKTLGIPSAEGFLLTTTACREYLNQQDDGHVSGFSDHQIQLVDEAIRRLEMKTKKQFGSNKNPLLVAVRSGAPCSMPGILDTYLYVGLNTDTVAGLARNIGKKAAWKACLEYYRTMATKWYGVNNEILSELPDIRMKPSEYSNTCFNLIKIIKGQIINNATVHGLAIDDNMIDDPRAQLYIAAGRVFTSWESPAANAFKAEHYLQDTGTAVLIQEMIPVHPKKLSGAGVAFSRDPITYDKRNPRCDFYAHRSGDAVVSDALSGSRQSHLYDIPQAIRQQLQRNLRILQNHFQHPQDVEYTVDKFGLVHALQTRNAPLSREATIRMAFDLLHGGKIDRATATKILKPNMLHGVLEPGLNPRAVEQAIQGDRLIAKGVDVAPGCGTGMVASTLENAYTMAKEDEMGADNGKTTHRPVVLWTSFNSYNFPGTLPENIVAIVLENGARSSHVVRHAERVAHKYGIPVVAGITRNSDTVSELTVVTVDGLEGYLFLGEIEKNQKNGNKILTHQEQRKVADVLRRWNKNPWRYIGDTTRADTYRRQRAELQVLVDHWDTIKGREYTALNAVLPELRESIYIPIKINREDLVDTIGHVRHHVEESLKAGYHATIRTCISSDQRGPYLVIRSMEELDGAIQNPTFSADYGCLNTILERADVAELLVGKIPIDKMSKDKPNAWKEHAAFSISVSSRGTVVLTCNDGSPLLRDLAAAKAEDLIVVEVDPSPLCPPEEKLKWHIGQNLTTVEREKRTDQVFGHVIEVLFHWLGPKHKLAERLAIFADVFPTDRYAAVALEAQMRINTNGERVWVGVYGANTDPNS